jgi:hypothetical protein
VRYQAFTPRGTLGAILRNADHRRACQQERKDMNIIKLSDTEVIESNRVVDFPDGPVTICKREVHEFYGPSDASSTRLVISDAVDRTLTFISKAREEFSELNSVMRELVTR